MELYCFCMSKMQLAICMKPYYRPKTLWKIIYLMLKKKACIEKYLFCGIFSDLLLAWTLFCIEAKDLYLIMYMGRFWLLFACRNTTGLFGKHFWLMICCKYHNHHQSNCYNCNTQQYLDIAIVKNISAKASFPYQIMGAHRHRSLSSLGVLFPPVKIIRKM